jgi:pimeloyl-ACP methyl ester carboxylesterase
MQSPYSRERIDMGPTFITGRSAAAPRRALLLVLVIVVTAIGVACAPPGPPPDPIIFVHGSSGSAQQFETNFQRLSSNGFPQARMYAFEYDTSRTDNTAEINAALDTFVARVRSETGAAQVDVLAHSRGTLQMHSWLGSSQQRADQVDDYVNYDGRTSTSPPGGRRTLAIWGEGSQTREIGGAQNSYFPNLAHTETVTSAATFPVVYEFLFGHPPLTTDVVPEPSGRATLAGRVLLFQENVAPTGARLEIWRVDPATGARLDQTPRYATDIGADGAFGPFAGTTTERYEIAVVRTRTQHFYFQPFRRNDHFLRLNLSREGQGLETLIETGPNHSVISNVRNREWWADQGEPAQNDRLQVNGADVLNGTLAPRSRRVIATFLFDDNSDRVTNLSAVVPPFGSLPFLTAGDVYLPADPQADGTLSLSMTPRGGGHAQSANVPDWPSSTDGISVQWRDD